MQVNLKPKDDWPERRPGHKLSTDELIEEMDAKLKQFQGINYNYSQPIIDNVAEAVAGMNASNAVKIFGDDLNTLNDLANQVIGAIRNVPGIKDVGILRNVGQPEISVLFDDRKMALYGVATADAQAVIEMAIGGKTASILYEGERKFDIRVRYGESYRRSEDDIMRLMVPTLRGSKIPLREIATIREVTGPAFVYRDNNKRFIGVKFSVRERDLGGTIAEAQERVNKVLKKLPKGYSVNWTGEFENQVRATGRLGQVVPLSLAAIFVILFIMFGNVKDAGLVLDQCTLRPDWRHSGLTHHRDELWYFGGGWLHCPVRHLRPERRHSHLGIQSEPKRPNDPRRGHSGGCAVAGETGGHDRHDGGYRAATSGRFDRHRLRNPEAIGHCRHWRTYHRHCTDPADFPDYLPALQPERAGSG